MRNKGQRALPHPLISPSSTDVLPNTFEFQCAVGDITCDRDAWHIAGRIHHECPEIAGLIAGGSATLGIHVECPRTFYRDWFPQANCDVDVTISKDIVRGRVELLAVCVAARDIAGYSPAGQHEDYMGSRFDLGAGDLLAVANEIVFDAFPDLDPIRKISSILDIRKKADQSTGPAGIVFEGDRITVDLAADVYQSYVEMRADRSIRGVLAANVVLPAVLQAVSYLGRLGPEELDEAKANRRWCRSLCARLDRAGLAPDASPERVFAAVQEILHEPIRRGIGDLLSQINAPRE
jgi:hypothetical protein